MSCDATSRLDGLPRVTTPWRGGGGGARPLDGWSDDTLRDHLRLMVEAGLLHGRVDAAGGVVFDRLSWAGHDFLAAVRQDSVWRKVRARLAAAGGGIAFEAVKTLALSLLP